MYRDNPSIEGKRMPYGLEKLLLHKRHLDQLWLGLDVRCEDGQKTVKKNRLNDIKEMLFVFIRRAKRKRVEIIFGIN